MGIRDWGNLAGLNAVMMLYKKEGYLFALEVYKSSQPFVLPFRGRCFISCASRGKEIKSRTCMTPGTCTSISFSNKSRKTLYEEAKKLLRRHVHDNLTSIV